MKQIYPKPGPAGGQILRKIVRLLKTGNDLPFLDSHIHIACSGGIDSTALASLMSRYGRRIVGSSNISLLHVSHGWDLKWDETQRKYIQKLSKIFEIPIVFEKIEKRIQGGGSLEEQGRIGRIEIFKRILKEPKNTVFTGHHLDDFFETWIWRFFTQVKFNEARMEESMSAFTDFCTRPLLEVSRAEILAYLEEEGLDPLLDPTNQSSKFLRGNMRLELIPALNSVFPGWRTVLRQRMGFIDKRVKNR